MALEMRGIYKSFGANDVLEAVDFALHAGEIHALIGENGAGKSTLMNILGGVLRPDAGEILLEGRRMRFARPADSLAVGIAFIHQELNLVPDLNVCENLFLGRERKRGALLNGREMRRQAQAVLARMDVPLSPTAMVRDLDASYKQVVEIARALMMRARIIIMDEPTTSLTEVEIERVFAMMRTVAQQGVSIIFISHKLGEVLAVCDRYTVLRDGVVAAEGRVAGVTEADLARHMVGHAVRSGRLQRKRALGEVALSAQALTLDTRFQNVSFQVRAGEILGFTGLLGDGRSALFQAVFGLHPDYAGEIRVAGARVRMRRTRDAFAAGIGYVPRDRKENGIVKDMSVLENMSLVTLARLRRGPFIDRARLRRLFRAQVRMLRIKLDSPREPIGSLSGGNQQKVVLAKWLAADPRILIFDNPTQGVDVGAKEEIYDIIAELADRGVAVIVLSSEAQEIIRLCDRALVMYHGEIRGELAGDDLSEHNVMVLATGGRPAAADSEGE